MGVFVEELALILAKHNKTINSLWSIGIHQAKVSMLIKSTSDTSRRISVTLNPEELTHVQKAFALSDSDMIHLNIAIIAEGVYRMLMDRVETQQAYLTGREVYQTLLNQAMTPKPDAPRIFVSHSSNDNIITTQLVADLRNERAFIWVDFDDISHGDFMTHINEGLKQCNWMILVLSPDAMHSPWVEKEVNAAFDMLIHNEIQGIIPIVVKPFETSDLPPLWRSLHRYDAYADYPGSLNGVLKALGLRS